MGLLRQIEWTHGVALSSLNLAEHEHQKWGEIDFLVFGDSGLIVVEVKGGLTECRQGVWTYTDRWGRVVRRNKSPLLQAKEAHDSLISKYIEVRFGREYLQGVPTGFCTVLAGTTRDEVRHLLGSPEFPPELWGCKEDVRDQGRFAAFLGTVVRHWSSRPHRGRPVRLTREMVDALVGYLRPEFERVPPLNLRLAHVRDELIKLTDDQYNAIDLWEGADRVLCFGPAGCGKTFLAMEIARRAVAAGNDVLLLTGTDHLADHLRLSAAPTRLRVASYSRLESGIDEYQPCDVLLIDEGQLLLTPDRVALLSKTLRGGLSEGRWVWFGDPAFQGQGADVASEALDQLKKLANVTPQLKRNCRNTPQIMSATELASGAPLGHALVQGAGPPVSWEYASGPASQSAAIAARIEGWINDGVPISDVVLLLGVEGCDELLQRVGERLGCAVRRWQPGMVASGRVLAWSTAQDFRGLESPLVIVCGIDPEIAGGELQRVLYLAMSRANVGLAMVLDPATQRAVQANARAKLELATAAERQTSK